jgi:hypothetical protein
MASPLAFLPTRSIAVIWRRKDKLDADSTECNEVEVSALWKRTRPDGMIFRRLVQRDQ